MDEFLIWKEIFDKISSNFSDLIVPIGTILVSLMAFCRVLSEILLVIVDKTETDKDNIFLEKLQFFMTILAKIIAWFGLGKSKKL